MPSRRLSSSPSSNSSAYFIIPIILTATILLIIFYLIYRLRLRRPATTPLLHSAHRFSYSQLLAATSGFSPHNAIGKGASATVYRGVLPTGKSVAVKLIDAASHSAQIEFHNELRILSRIDSPYVVALLGYCVRNEHRVLVYEYMPNRSLQETLFGESGGAELSWDQRFRIVQDVAAALAYLHLECDPPIIHGDIKPSNVLLDMDFRARVSDFGLSRVKQEAEEDHDPSFSQQFSGNVAAVDIDGATPAAGSSSHYSYNEVDFAQALQANSASLKNEFMLKDHLVMVDSLDENAQSNTCREDGQHCVGEDPEAEEARQWGEDWWWRQDGSGELCSKDYVKEWIGSQICPRSWADDCDNDDDEEKSASHCSRPLPVFDNRVQLQMPELPLAKKEGSKWMIRGEKKKKKKKKHRKLHEWWREEQQPEISKTRLKLRILDGK